MPRPLLFLLFCLMAGPFAKAQIFCPPNIDFEQGSLNNWSCFTSINTGSGNFVWTPTIPLITRHTITTGISNDPYGGFPITAPGGGIYALKLGNDGSGGEMEKTHYVIHIPVGTNDYSLIYRYAVVFQNPPNHLPQEKPFFSVIAYDSVTNTQVPCNSNTFVASGTLPGFIETSPGSNIWYKDWSTSSLKLNGLGGRTIIVEFTSADCSQLGHFGYGYIDMSCGLFAINSANCNGAPLTPLTAPPGFQNYTWYNSNYSTVIGFGPTITIPTPSVTTSYHVVLDPFPGYGCADTLTTQVRFSTLSVNALPDSAGLCTIGTIQLNVSQTGSAPPFTYSWTPVLGLGCAYCPNPIASPSLNTVYYVDVTDNNGCTVRDSVVIRAGVSASSTFVNATCATATNGTATVNAIGGTLPYTYSWNTVPAQTTATATGLAPGSYTCTITDATNCTATKTVTIGITTFSLTSTNNSVFCPAATNGQATVNVVGGTSPLYSFSWNTVPVQTTQTATNLGGGTYVVTVTHANGCSQTRSITIPVLPFSVNESHSNVSCNGYNNGTATALVPSGGAGPYTYSWNTIPVQTTQSISGLAPGTYTVTVTDNGTCAASKTATITQPAPLVVSGTSGVLYCNYLANGIVTALVTGGNPPYYYNWNTTPAQLTQAATGLVAGTYVCNVVDARGCTGTVTRSLTELSPVHVYTSIVSRSCAGQDNNILTAVGSGGTGALTYLWNTVPPTNSQTTGGLASGTYKVTVTDAVGCKAFDSANVTSFPGLTITASPDREICAGDTTMLSVTGATSYSWTPAAGLTCTNCANPIANSSITTLYTVIGSDANGCSDTDEVEVRVIERVPVGVDSGKNVCYGSEIMLGAHGGEAYQWTPEESLQGSFLANPIARPLKTTTYQVIIAENKCFTDTLSQTITVLPLPTIDIGNGFTGIPGATVQLNAITTNAHTITWQPPNGLSCYDCYNPVVTLSETIIYLAEVTDTFGCKAVDTIRIIVGCNPDAFFMANTFTPNNDGRNDYFYPQAMGINTVSRFMILNRWGETMFIAKDIPVNVQERGWDGTFQGKELPPDVFVYAIEAICANGQPIVLKGDITLVR